MFAMQIIPTYIPKWEFSKVLMQNLFSVSYMAMKRFVIILVGGTEALNIHREPFANTKLTWRTDH